jgi:hypothetical protein
VKKAASAFARIGRPCTSARRDAPRTPTVNPILDYGLRGEDNKAIWLRSTADRQVEATFRRDDAVQGLLKLVDTADDERHQGQERSQGRRTISRWGIDMPALIATRYNSDFKAKYDQLIGEDGYLP